MTGDVHSCHCRCGAAALVKDFTTRLPSDPSVRVMSGPPFFIAGCSTCLSITAYYPSQDAAATALYRGPSIKINPDEYEKVFPE